MAIKAHVYKRSGGKLLRWDGERWEEREDEPKPGCDCGDHHTHCCVTEGPFDVMLLCAAGHRYMANASRSTRVIGKPCMTEGCLSSYADSVALAVPQNVPDPG